MAFESPVLWFQVLVGGTLFFGHGLRKLKNPKGTIAWFKSKGYGTLGGVWAMATEGIASVLLVFGVFPRVMAALIAVTMAGALMFHAKNKDPFNKWEPAFLFLVAMLFLAFAAVSPWGLVLG